VPALSLLWAVAQGGFGSAADDDLQYPGDAGEFRTIRLHGLLVEVQPLNPRKSPAGLLSTPSDFDETLLRFVIKFAFCRSRMLTVPASTILPGSPWQGWWSGISMNVEIYGQRVGKQIG
jgi:hypothetical protein